jgi:hypothetical protein
MEIAGYNNVPDWPKMGPSLLIATCVIVAIRTARWSATIDARNSNSELDREIKFAADVAQRVLSKLEAKHPSIFPRRKAALVQSEQRRFSGLSEEKSERQTWCSALAHRIGRRE